jgi:hypothetical protein
VAVILLIWKLEFSHVIVMREPERKTRSSICHRADYYETTTCEYFRHFDIVCMSRVMIPALCEDRWNSEPAYV